MSISAAGPRLAAAVARIWSSICCWARALSTFRFAISSLLAIGSTNTPRNGTRMTKTSQSVLAPPPMSVTVALFQRRKKAAGSRPRGQLGAGEGPSSTLSPTLPSRPSCLASTVLTATETEVLHGNKSDSAPSKRAKRNGHLSINSGPVDYLVVEFPAGASNFTGEMAKELLALVDSGTIRVIDVLILTKNEDGSVHARSSRTSRSSDRFKRSRPSWPSCLPRTTSSTSPPPWIREAPPECSSGRTSGRRRSHRLRAVRVVS